jgi:pimeloyl-ACP methyl ester carboxylesterase
MPASGDDLLSTAVREIQAYANNQFIESSRVPGGPPFSWNDPAILATSGIDPETRYLATSFNGQTTVYLSASRLGPSTGTSFLRVIRLGADGKELARTDFPGVEFSPPGEEFLPAISETERGTLIPLRDKADPTRSVHLYLLGHDNSLRLISTHAKAGVWTDRGDIVVNRSTHAASSELVLLRGPQFTQALILSQPPGYKKGLKITREKLSYVCDRHTERTAIVETDTASNTFRIIESAPAKLVAALIPAAKEVVYPGGNGLVAAMLDLPDGKCEEGPQRPAFVYVHGGNSNGNPRGQQWLGNAGNQIDHLVLSQLGAVVLEANYFGDQYAGKEFAKGGSRYKPIEGYAPQIADIMAAGRYLKSLPCVDPERIVLFGHSYGAILSALLLTDTSVVTASGNPFSAIVLRGGLYTRDAWRLNPLTDALSPRLAVRDTEDGKVLDPNSPYFKAYIHAPVFKPEKPISDPSEAIALLKSLNTAGTETYGVAYSLSDHYLDSISADQRAARAVLHVPVLLMEGVDSMISQTEAFKAALEAQRVPAQAWYPANGGHDFYDETQVEMAVRIRHFIESLHALPPQRR